MYKCFSGREAPMFLSTQHFAARKQKFLVLGSDSHPLDSLTHILLNPPNIFSRKSEYVRSMFGCRLLKHREKKHIFVGQHPSSQTSQSFLAKKHCRRWHLPWWPSPLCLRTPHLKEVSGKTKRIGSDWINPKFPEPIFLAKLKEYRFWKLLAELGIWKKGEIHRHPAPLLSGGVLRSIIPLVIRRCRATHNTCFLAMLDMHFFTSQLVAKASASRTALISFLKLPSNPLVGHSLIFSLFCFIIPFFAIGSQKSPSLGVIKTISPFTARCRAQRPSCMMYPPWHFLQDSATVSYMAWRVTGPRCTVRCHHVVSPVWTPTFSSSRATVISVAITSPVWYQCFTDIPDITMMLSMSIVSIDIYSTMELTRV